MSKKEALEELIDNPISRRSFAKRVGMISAGVAGTSLLGGSLVKAVAQQSGITPAGAITDVDILNFAPTSNILRASLYSCHSGRNTRTGRNHPCLCRGWTDHRGKQGS